MGPARHRRAPRRRHSLLALVTALATLTVALGSTAASATPTSTTSTSTTTMPAPPSTAPTPSTPPTTEAPAPPAFPMGYDAGPKLIAERQTAAQDIATLRPRVAASLQVRDRLRHSWSQLLARLAKSEHDVRAAEHRLAELHDQVTSIAAQAYTQGATQRVTAAVGAMVASDDIVQASRDLVFIDRVGTHTTELVDQYVRRKRALEQRVRDINAQRIELRGRLDNATATYNETQREYTGAQTRLANATTGLERFRQLATTSASPILGPSFLTPEDLAAFVTSRGYHPHLTVPLLTLARLFIQEADKVGVRGDVAWAQSILETGFFTYPGSGSLVNNTDNNFAGVGACDSCAHGFVFRSARVGARAQVQLLRTYVDKSFTAKTSVDPLVLPRTQRLGFRGKIHSWWDLGHHWATGANYGDHLYAIYMQMVTFANHRDPGH